MKYGRILRGLAGLGAHKLGKKLERMFEGGPKVPPGVCACTKWRSFSQPPRETEAAGTKSAYWHKTCRGPGNIRLVATIVQPGIKFEQVRRGKSQESGFEQRATRYAAEAEIDIWEAPSRDAVPNEGAVVEPNWHHRSRHPVGYFRTEKEAKRRSEAKIGQLCEETLQGGK